MWIINQSGEAINLASAYKIKAEMTSVQDMPGYHWAVDVYYPSPENGMSVDDEIYSLWIETFKTREEAEKYIAELVDKLNSESLNG